MKQNRFKQRFLLSARTFALVLIPFSFCACSSIDLDTDPFESPDEATFWEKCQRTILGAHDCRQHERCRTLCPFEEEKLKEQKIEETESWKAFLTMTPYAPARRGVRLIDAANDALASLSAQIIEDVINPYVELDKEGHLVAYRTFLDEVNLRIELKKEKGIDLSFSDSVKQTEAYWQAEYGPEQYQAFLNALPFVERMQAGNQIVEAIPGLLSSAEKILGTIEKGVSELLSIVGDDGDFVIWDAWTKRAKVPEPFAGTVEECDKLIWGLIYMQVLDPDHAEEREKIESALADFLSEKEEEVEENAE